MGTGGCRACDCHPGGSLSPYCHPDNGSCECRSGVIGQRCDTVAPGQFVVTGLTLNEMRKLPINGEFSIWLRIHPDVSCVCVCVIFFLQFNSNYAHKLAMKCVHVHTKIYIYNM